MKVQVRAIGELLLNEVAPETEEPTTETEKIMDSEQDNKKQPTPTKRMVLMRQKKKSQIEKEEMTLVEYEKVLEEKRKTLTSLKCEERKVGLDKHLAKMNLLSNKKSEEDIFFKLIGEGKQEYTDDDLDKIYEEWAAYVANFIFRP